MIGKIRGTVAEIDGSDALVETSSGVFYRVMCSPGILAHFPLGSAISLYTYHLVREDVQGLFGFEDIRAYRMFILLIGISGVGPKSAYGILSVANPEEIVRAVRSNDSGFFTKIPGLGKKTSLKIILELSSKFKSEFVLESSYVDADDQLVLDALKALGFASAENQKILPKLDRSLSVAGRVAQALALMTS